MVSKISFGKAGEIYASRYLIKKGYRIIEKNYRCRFGEIDIIAEKNNVIHFIEVKTRRSLHYGAPEESIDPKKINKLKFVSEFFLTEKKLADSEVSIDAVTLFIKDGKVTLNHLLNIL